MKSPSDSIDSSAEIMYCNVGVDSTHCSNVKRADGVECEMNNGMDNDRCCGMEKMIDQNDLEMRHGLLCTTTISKEECDDRHLQEVMWNGASYCCVKGQ